MTMKTHPPTLHKKHRASQGFTLLELIAGMAMTLTVSALALQALSNSQKSFSADRDNIEIGQKLSSVLDIISRDIRQAGEQITESRFPVIQVIPSTNNTGSRLVMYRALSDPLPLCNNPALPSGSAIPAGTATTSFLTSSNVAAVAISTPNCNINFLNTTSAQTRQATWQNIRTDTKAGTANAPNGQLYGIIHDRQGFLQPFIYTTETVPTVAALGNITTQPFTPAQNLPIQSNVYIVEKREYLVCLNPSNNVWELKVWVNSSNTGCTAPNSDPRVFQTIASNVIRLDISTSIRTPVTTPGSTAPDVVSDLPRNTAFPTATSTWQNIQGLKVQLEAQDTSNPGGSTSRNKLKVEGKFYPRNILSAR
jgi:type II secretory pathway pseudopilin PulG